jgi:DNA polymerase III delta prime subunit
MGCNNCKSCKAFDNGWHSDFKIFTHETHKEGEKEIDQYREVQLFLGYKPQVSSNRILIIDQFEQMTRDAQSTSLKLLEEPFPNSIIIVISSFASKLPETILSRLLPIRFTKEPEGNLKNFLKDNFKIKEDDLDFYLALGDNKIGKTINLIEDPEYLKEKIDNIKLLINIIDNNFVNASGIISKITTKAKKKVNDEKEEDSKDNETEEKENKGDKELNQMVKD